MDELIDILTHNRAVILAAYCVQLITIVAVVLIFVILHDIDVKTSLVNDRAAAAAAQAEAAQRTANANTRLFQIFFAQFVPEQNFICTVDLARAASLHVAIPSADICSVVVP